MCRPATRCVCTAAACSSNAVGADSEGRGAPVWQGWLRSHGGGKSPPEHQCVRPSEPPATLQNVSRLKRAESRQMICSINNTRKVHNVPCVEVEQYMCSRKGCRCILVCCCNRDACSYSVHHLTLSSPQICLSTPQVCLSSLQLLVQLLADIISLLEPVEENTYLQRFVHNAMFAKQLDLF